MLWILQNAQYYCSILDTWWISDVQLCWNWIFKSLCFVIWGKLFHVDFANPYSPLLYVMSVLKIRWRLLVFFVTLPGQVLDFIFTWYLDHKDWMFFCHCTCRGLSEMGQNTIWISVLTCVIFFLWSEVIMKSVGICSWNLQ